MDELRSVVHVAVDTHRDVPLLTVTGVLDSSTYRIVRDSVIKTALGEPRAVIVDVNGLAAPSVSAWSAFTSARWHVSIWPDVPVLLVCAQPRTRQAIRAGGAARYLPVHPTLDSAVDALGDPSLPLRRRASVELLRARASVGRARDVVSDWLTRWGSPEMVSVAATVATVLIENVLDHTDSAPVLIVESDGSTVTVAVQDLSDTLPCRHEDAYRGAEIVSGLAIVSALCQAWGANPTSSGKTVWASVGRENKI
ncbi:STAS domain-containing protein [Mycobacterium parmense]|uniref:Sulfate transporter n=1 Tax=Mycobacterium parmense TaxID=185642 RepID=A0A7I7YX82_9MYCO|nr:STAS domain-containing protein [Mycobacterium parmense]MCV7351208.1 STAS domain-containing protein [Mycobacterium parmense]ORW61010.1 sulfate transporter [Mycobacterium parmense]BBZ45341.1 sulfate transporter [Mycobacterium parmense]